MCVIAVCEKRKMTDKEIESAWRVNSDGAGIAWVENGENRYMKGIMSVREFKKIYRSINTYPHIIHFRLSSVGDVMPELCHPFIVHNDAPLELEYKGENPLLFHNGTVADWKKLFLQALPVILQKDPTYRVPPPPYSDTRIAAILVSIMGENVLHFLEGKYALLKNKTVYLYGEFYDEKGILFSNTHWQFKNTYFYSYSLPFTRQINRKKE